MKAGGPILVPQISRIPGSSGVEESRPKKGELIGGEDFGPLLEQALNTQRTDNQKDLGQVGARLKFSAHAAQRLRDRQIQFDPEMMLRMSNAIDKADAKGVQDTLVLTDKAALIVSVPNRTVITAMDRDNLTGNVFTNIDGAVIV
jgi:flagellar operon protein